MRVLSFEVERILRAKAELITRKKMTCAPPSPGVWSRKGTHLFLEHGGFDSAHPLLQISYQIMSGGRVRLIRQPGETLTAEESMSPSANR